MSIYLSIYQAEPFDHVFVLSRETQRHRAEVDLGVAQTEHLSSFISNFVALNKLLH